MKSWRILYRILNIPFLNTIWTIVNWILDAESPLFISGFWHLCVGVYFRSLTLKCIFNIHTYRIKEILTFSISSSQLFFKLSGLSLLVENDFVWNFWYIIPLIPRHACFFSFMYLGMQKYHFLHCTMIWIAEAFWLILGIGTSNRARVKWILHEKQGSFNCYPVHYLHFLPN